MGIDDVMNDINAWLVDEDDDSMEVDLRKLVGKPDDGHETADRTKKTLLKMTWIARRTSKLNTKMTCQQYRHFPR